MKKSFNAFNLWQKLYPLVLLAAFILSLSPLGRSYNNLADSWHFINTAHEWKVVYLIISTGLFGLLTVCTLVALMLMHRYIKYINKIRYNTILREL